MSLALVALVAACSSAVKSVFKQPEVRFQGWGVRTLSLDGPVLDVRLRVVNPNGFSFTAQKLDYTLFVDSAAVGLGGLDSSVVVPANDSVVVTFPIKLGLGAVSQVGPRLLRGGLVPYRVQGDVTVRTFAGTFSRRFDERGTYDAAKALNLR
mgnify:FL=1